MQAWKENFTTVKSKMRYFNGIFQQLFISALVYVVYEITQKRFFRCPCNYHTFYGVLFMVIPALFVLGLGLVTSEEFWTYIKKRNTTAHTTKCTLFMRSLRGVFVPFVGPTVWVVTGLLHGDIYVCANYGPLESCKSSAKQDPGEHLSFLHMQSQVLGFALLLAFTVMMVGVAIIEHRNRGVNTTSLPSMHEYSCLENETLVKMFQQKLQEIAVAEARGRIELAFQKSNTLSLREAITQAREDLLEGMVGLNSPAEHTMNGIEYVQVPSQHKTV